MPKPLQLLWANSEKAMAKKDMTAIAANVTADEIARFLNLADAGQAVLLSDEAVGSVAVSGGDIAVLVRNHRQAYTVQQCLQVRGINSVQQGRENVFGSSEALMLQRVIFALAEPQKSSADNSRLIDRVMVFYRG